MPTRFAPAAFLAAGITFTLFFLMTALVHVPDVIIHPTPLPVVELVNVMLEQPPPPPPEREPELRKVEPEPFIPRVTLDPGTSGINLPLRGSGSEGHTEGGPGLLMPSMAEGDAVPIVRMAPDYPRSALSRGIEGRVLVEFDVDRVGAVKDARVIAAEPANVFERAALEAVRQWRYSPRVENGRATERRGLRIAIPFRLGNDRSALR